MSGSKRETSAHPELNACGYITAEFFSGVPSIEVEYSRYRFALADRPDMSERWDAVRREYRMIQARRAAFDDSPSSVSAVKTK